MRKQRIFFLYFLYFFILIFLFVPLKVYGLSLTSDNRSNSGLSAGSGFNAVPTLPLIPAQATSTANNAVPQAAVPPQEPQSQQVPDIPENQIKQELQPLVKDYLTATGRDLSNLDTVVDNFSYLILGKDKGGLGVFSIDDIENILQDENTPELEAPLAAYLDKDNLDLTNKDDAAALANFASLIAVDKTFTLSGIIGILKGPNTKQLEKPLAAFLGKVNLDLTNRNDAAALANFASFLTNKIYTFTLSELKQILEDKNVKSKVQELSPENPAYTLYLLLNISEYLNAKDPSKIDEVIKWYKSTCANWQTDNEQQKAEELIFYIQLKPIIQDLYPELTQQQNIDRQVASLAALIKGGLQGKDLYEINDFQKLYETFISQNISSSLPEMLTNPSLKELMEGKYYDSGKDTLTITTDEQYLGTPNDYDTSEIRKEGEHSFWEAAKTREGISFAEQMRDWSNVDSIQFNLLFSPNQTYEDGNPLEKPLYTVLAFKLQDMSGKNAVAYIDLSDYTTEGKVSLKKSDFTADTDFNWSKVNTSSWGIEYDLKGTCEDNYITIDDKVELKGIRIEHKNPLYFDKPEDRKFFLENLAGFKAWGLPRDENYIKYISRFITCIDKQKLKEIIENVKSNSDRLFAERMLPEKINKIIHKYFYPTFLRIRDISALEEFNLPIIIDAERIVRELKNLNVDKATLSLIEFELLLRRINSLRDKKSLPQENSRYCWNSLRILPEDILYKVKKVIRKPLKSWIGGGYRPNLRYVLLYDQENPLFFKPPDIEVIAHELAHHLDLTIMKEYESYTIRKYTDISNLFYKVYDAMFQKETSYKYNIENIGESVAYYFGEYVAHPDEKILAARMSMQTNDFTKAIQELIATYLLAFDKGYGLAYGFNPYYPPLTFSEVRIAMTEAKGNGFEIPPILEEALNACELIFYKWRKDAGFEVENPIMSKYEGLSYKELKEKIEQDFPNFYPEVLSYGIDFIKKLQDGEAILPERLQGLKQIEFEIQRSYSFIPSGIKLLNEGIASPFNLLLLGYLGEKLKEIIRDEYKISLYPWVLWENSEKAYYKDEILNTFFSLLENKSTDRLLRYALCSYLADLLNVKEYDGIYHFENPILPETKETIEQRLKEIVSRNAELEGIFNKIISREGNLAKIIERNYEEENDYLEIHKHPLYLENAAKRFLSRIKKLSKEDLLTLGVNQDLSPEKLATEIVLNFWSNLMPEEEIIQEIVHNNWTDFLWDLKMMAEKYSWRIYKETVKKFEPKTQIVPSDLPSGVTAIKVTTVPNSERGMKEFIEDLKSEGKLWMPEFYGFDDRWNGDGREYGSWNAFPKDYSQYCRNSYSNISFGGIGSSLRLDYDVESENPKGAYNGFWMEIGKDLSEYQALVLFLRGDEIAGFPYRIKITLEDKDRDSSQKKGIIVRRSDIYIEGIAENWRMAVIPLEKFLGNGNLKDLTSIDILSITFEKDIVGQNAGIIYIDEIGFLKDISLLKQ